MAERNIDYENKFKAYLYKGNIKRFAEICEQLNIKPNLDGLVVE
jgi:hypothetical protein